MIKKSDPPKNPSSTLGSLSLFFDGIFPKSELYIGIIFWWNVFLVEGEHVEPGALVARRVQVHPHRVLLWKKVGVNTVPFPKKTAVKKEKKVVVM